MARWSDELSFDMAEFDVDHAEGCARLQAAVLEADSDNDLLSEAAEQIHHSLCEALVRPLKASQRFLQCLTELMISSSLPLDVILQNKSLALSMDQDGSRLVQAALQAGDRKVQAGIIAELHGHVCEMMGSPHANHVLQRVVELLPPGAVSFILHEMCQKWSPDFMAKHKFGCRVLERMIEHFPCGRHAFPVWDEFLDRLLQSASVHCYHAFATFIMQHIMEHGTDEHRRVIVAALTQDLEHAALDTYASGVLDKAFCFLPVDERSVLAWQVLQIDGLFGRMVAANRPAAERLLRVASGPLMSEARRQLDDAFPDATTRSKVLKYLFGGKDPSWERLEVLGMSASTVHIDVLSAPIPQSMSQNEFHPPGQLSIPQQESMVSAPHMTSSEFEEAWWNSSVLELFGLWSTNPWSDGHWNTEVVDHWA